MALSELERKRIEKQVDAYVRSHRPPSHLRDQLDIAFRIKGQSIEIFEVRPAWREPGVTIENPIAKATYVRTQDVWRVYWQRADLKWHQYEPHPEAKSVEEFLAVVEADEYACFYG